MSASRAVRRARPHGVSGGAARDRHVARHRGDVLQVAAHDGDYVQQAVGNFLNVLAAAIGLVGCCGGAGVVAGRGQEVTERGTRGHGLLLSSPQMSRALWAACRQAARSPVSGGGVGGLRQAFGHQVAQPGHHLGHALGRLTGPGQLFCRHGEQRVPGQRRRQRQGVAAVRGGRGGHHEGGEQAAARVLDGMDDRHHPLERLIGGIQDASQIAGLLQALLHRVNPGHLTSPVRQFTGIIAAPRASAGDAEHICGQDATPEAELCTNPLNGARVAALVASHHRNALTSHRG